MMTSTESPKSIDRIPRQRRPSSPETGPSPAGTDRVTRAARVLTEIFSPGYLVALLLAAVAWTSSRSVAQAVLVSLIAVAAASVLPMVSILRGVRRGRWTDKHVVVHAQRRVPLLIILLSTAGGMLALVAVSAPRQLLALIAAMVAALLVAVPITVFLHWGISIHALVAAGTSVALCVVFGPVLALTAPVAVAVGWARVRLGEHTVAQVLAGGLVGTCATGLLFPLLAG